MTGRVSKVIDWAKRKLARLRSVFWPSLRRAAAPFGFAAPVDILAETPNRFVDVPRPKGVAPLRPGTAEKAEFTTERTQRLLRNAVAFLFDFHDFATVPAQFWPFLERLHDPGIALSEFLSAVGVDPELVRRQDPVETGKARDVIDLLVRSGTVLHRLKPEVRQEVTRKLGSGDYAAVREAAELAAHLQSALDFASRWLGKPVFASFRELLTTLQKMLDDPMRYSASDAAGAVDLVAQFDTAQSLYDEMISRFELLTKALGDAWPDAWRGGPHEAALRGSVDGFEDAAETMRASSSLGLDELMEGNAYLFERIRELDDLLEAALGGAKKRTSGKSGSSGKSRSSGGTGKSSKTGSLPDELELALIYFGFSKARPPQTKVELRAAWKAKFKALHPDRNIGAAPDVLARNKAQLDLCEPYYSALLRHFSWR